MTMRNRNPGLPRSSDVPIKKAETKFYGMLTGVPASELPAGYSAKNVNVIDRGSYYDVRNGSRLYTSFRIAIEITSVDTNSDEMTLTSVHQWNTGDIVFMKGDGLPTPLVEGTAYYVIKGNSKKIKLATTYANAIAGTQINLTSDITDTSYVFYGYLNAKYDHTGKNIFVVMFGNSVYIANKKLNVFTRVLNLSSVDPSGISSMCAVENYIFLFSNTGIFKIYLDDDFYWMDVINKPVPIVLISDINESASLIYGYLYIYSMALLAGTGNRDRNDGNKILFESGTCNNSKIKEYGERYYSTELGVDLANNHSVGVMTLPDSVTGITHFPLYRSRNIGMNSGGSGVSINSIGNRRDFLLWVADVPVAKAFVIDTSTTPGTGIIVSGNKFVYGDATCTLKDAAGNTATISAYTDVDHVTLGAGLASGTAIYCAIGGGRVMQCSQVGNVVTRSAGDSFTTTDKGLLLFVSDGTYRHVVKYLTANTVEVAESGNFTNLAVTLKPTSGNFSRSWNDGVPDDPQGDGRVSWYDIELYANDNYVPRRFFEPIPDCNIGVIDNGFAVCAKREYSDYWYSQIGDKLYNLGYYVNPEQTKKVAGAIQYLALFSNKVVIVTDKTTIELITTSSTNAGRTTIGENIFQLPEPNTIDPKTGIKSWQSVVFKSVKATIYMFALCNDNAYRYFDGNSWGEDVSIINGLDAVSKKYLKLADEGYGIISFYSSFAGLKLWFRKWDELVNNTGNIYHAVQMFIDNVEATTEVQLVLNEYADGGNDRPDKQYIIL